MGPNLKRHKGEEESVSFLFFGCLYPTCHMTTVSFSIAFFLSFFIPTASPTLTISTSHYQEKIKAKNTKVNEDLFFLFPSLGLFRQFLRPQKMSALVGAISKDVTFNPVMAEKEENKNTEPTQDDPEKTEGEAQDDDDDEDDDEADEDTKQKKPLENKELELGPQFSLKEQLEKDKDDESLRRWKEQLLGTVDFSAVGESKEPEVQIQSLSILCKDRPVLVFAIPLAVNPKDRLFTLKEGSQYHVKFTFVVSSNIVSGLKYIHTVWKAGLKVDNTKIMLGTFSPQLEPYTYQLEEETTPSGMFARGSYSARSKFVDDDGKCYLDFSYTFDIQKNWPSTT